MGAEADLVHLNADNEWLSRIENIAAAVRPTTKVIALNNPNGPTGALVPKG